MWIVYHEDDSWECGFLVKDLQEAIAYCKENKEYKYIYIDISFRI